MPKCDAAETKSNVHRKIPINSLLEENMFWSNWLHSGLQLDGTMFDSHWPHFHNSASVHFRFLNTLKLYVCHIIFLISKHCSFSIRLGTNRFLGISIKEACCMSEKYLNIFVIIFALLIGNHWKHLQIHFNISFN